MLFIFSPLRFPAAPRSAVEMPRSFSSLLCLSICRRLFFPPFNKQLFCASEAFKAFLSSASFSILARARARLLGQRNRRWQSEANIFQFYPAEIDIDGRNAVGQSLKLGFIHFSCSLLAGHAPTHTQYLPRETPQCDFVNSTFWRHKLLKNTSHSQS